MECTVSEGVVKVVFQHYCDGLATALLINHTIDTAIEYCQKYVAFTLCPCLQFLPLISVEICSVFFGVLRTFTYLTYSLVVSLFLCILIKCIAPNERCQDEWLDSVWYFVHAEQSAVLSL